MNSVDKETRTASSTEAANNCGRNCKQGMRQRAGTSIASLTTDGAQQDAVIEDQRAMFVKLIAKVQRRQGSQFLQATLKLSR